MMKMQILLEAKDVKIEEAELALAAERRRVAIYQDERDRAVGARCQAEADLRATEQLFGELLARLGAVSAASGRDQAQREMVTATASIVWMLLVSFPTASAQAKPCLTKIEARQLYKIDHIYWHGSAHCWGRSGFGFEVGG